MSLAAAATLLSAAIWYGFVRPADRVRGGGVITGKTFVPAHTIKRLQAGANRQVWTEEQFRVPDSYLFQLSVEDVPTVVQYSLDALSAKQFEVGQKVTVQYEVRGFPLMSKRIRVTGMTRAEAP